MWRCGDVGVGARPMGSGNPALIVWGVGGVSMVDQKALGVNGKHLPRPAGNFGKPSSNIYIYMFIISFTATTINIPMGRSLEVSKHRISTAIQCTQKQSITTSQLSPYVLPDPNIYASYRPSHA